MPTWDALESFWRDYAALSREAKQAFRAAKTKFAEDADTGAFRPSLRVKPMQAKPGLWEMTWEGSDGRATFMYGPEILPGKRHVVWRRIGTHAIFREP